MTQMMQHPGMRCATNGDPLILAEIELQMGRNMNMVSCKACNTFKMKYGYFCRKCRDCYCLSCGNTIAKQILESTGKLCKNGHAIEWSTSPIIDDTYFCSVCKQYFACGVFFCSGCEDYYCPKDINSLN